MKYFHYRSWVDSPPSQLLRREGTSRGDAWSARRQAWIPNGALTVSQETEAGWSEITEDQVPNVKNELLKLHYAHLDEMNGGGLDSVS